MEIRSPQLRPERVLIIKSVRQDGTQWKADAEHGLPTERPGRHEATVTAVGSTVTVEFIAAMHSR
jgi:hypothetical protein